MDQSPSAIYNSDSNSTDLLTMLPLEVFEEVFLNVPPQQVVCVCRLVSQEWKEVVDSDSLWRKRCRREGYLLRDATTPPKDWRLFYFMCKNRHNLLKNPIADDKFNGWDLIENGGDKWGIGSVRVPLPDNTVQHCFVTSYGPCNKCQLIHLEKEGYSPAFMDDVQPDIVISDWYVPRSDCGAIYQICVQLLNQEKKTIEKFNPPPVVFQYGTVEQWNQMTHVFKNYGRGVRYIGFVHGGRDTQYWAGRYGIRITNSSVEICPSVDSSL
ncbi:hypothetical protein UPYG_G00007650 [Umbra pygmaea]|uniref:Uncharacterized protein n=1 Tax=Umbra pygmaea TaxID=75934 RepID=A0ABD0XHU6_UMBPY